MEVVEAVEVIEVAEVLRSGKSLLRTSESSRFLNSVFFLIFWKNIVLVESWNIILKFSTFSFGGCWGQPMLLFWKLVDETQMSTSNEATKHPTSKKCWSFYPSEPFSFTRFTMRHPVCGALQLHCRLELSLRKTWGSALESMGDWN